MEAAGPTVAAARAAADGVFYVRAKVKRCHLQIREHRHKYETVDDELRSDRIYFAQNRAQYNRRISVPRAERVYHEADEVLTEQRQPYNRSVNLDERFTNAERSPSFRNNCSVRWQKLRHDHYATERHIEALDHTERRLMRERATHARNVEARVESQRRSRSTRRAEAVSSRIAAGLQTGKLYMQDARNDSAKAFMGDDEPGPSSIYQGTAAQQQMYLDANLMHDGQWAEVRRKTWAHADQSDVSEYQTLSKGSRSRQRPHSFAESFHLSPLTLSDCQDESSVTPEADEDEESANESDEQQSGYGSDGTASRSRTPTQIDWQLCDSRYASPERQLTPLTTPWNDTVVDGQYTPRMSLVPGLVDDNGSIRSSTASSIDLDTGYVPASDDAAYDDVSIYSSTAASSYLHDAQDGAAIHDTQMLPRHVPVEFGPNNVVDTYGTSAQARYNRGHVLSRKPRFRARSDISERMYLT